MESSEILTRLQSVFPQTPLSLDATQAIIVPANSIYAVCVYLQETSDLVFDSLLCLSGVDRGENLEVVYHLYSMIHGHKVTLKAQTPRTDPKVPTVSTLWRTADWHEREAYDLFGIVFLGHPDLRRILMPEDWNGYPLRKDYTREGMVKLVK
ncbi:MAG: NADH-quinone oxidoreductase subunit C [bacterium]|nr:NADH-quinone oxidoreductase subunit C [bacterium]